MDSESKIQQFLLLGKNARGRSCAEIIAKATSEPGLFAFGELLDMPNVQEVGNLSDAGIQPSSASEQVVPGTAAARVRLGTAPHPSRTVLLWHV